MRSLGIFGIALLALTNQTLGQQQSPYVEYQGRSIMALSVEPIGSYQAGDGMGFALAAELNGYPGPRHVLELADSLSLDTVQQERVQAAFDSMRRRAQVLGTAVVDQEQILDSLFAAGTITNERLESILAELAQLQGQLRTVHLAAHVALVGVLSEHQIREYQRLRGYTAGQHQHPRSL